MLKLLFGFLVLFSTSSYAISESDYAAQYNEKIVPLLQKFKNGKFLGVKDISIHFATYTSNPSSQKCLVILPGRSEPLEKYAEVVYDLDHGELAGEFQFFLMDHRGQGSSGRMITKKPSDFEKGHVDRFKNYTTDVKTFLDTVLSKTDCSEKYLLAHSLGAGIAVDFLQKFPQYFLRAALSSPMLKIQTAPYKYGLAKSIVVASILLGRGKKYAIGQTGFSDVRDFEANTFTSSVARYHMTMNLYDTYPETRLGDTTNNWVNQVMVGTRKIRKKYQDIHIPLKVFHAGIEVYSEPEEMVRLCDQARECQRTLLETSKHEVMMDRDVNRNVVISELVNFFR